MANDEGLVWGPFLIPICYGSIKVVWNLTKQTRWSLQAALHVGVTQIYAVISVGAHDTLLTHIIKLGASLPMDETSP